MVLSLMIWVMVIAGPAFGQKKDKFPEDELRIEEVSSHLRFLASDEMRGRLTGTPWIDLAARYVAEQFRAVGLSRFPGSADYLQIIPLVRRVSPSTGYVLVAHDTLVQGKRMMVRSGGAMDWKGGFAFVGYGLSDSAGEKSDYGGKNLKGKVAVAMFGAPGGGSLYASISSLAEQKRQLAEQHGAVALVELYRGAREWRTLASFFGRAGLEVESAGGDLPHFIVEDTAGTIASGAIAQPSGVISVMTPGLRAEKTPSSNVIGYVRGADARLRDEYILLTAHYDHLGTRASRTSSPDTIYNGARDNAMGTVALIAAARSFVAQPPKRSVIIAALTGEEVGGYGSRYLAEHPPVPMNHIVFDLNTDGAGFDDTTIVTVVGLERTTAHDAIASAVRRYGLTAIKDPVPEQNLFNRSDNTKFASLGVPAPTFSAGFHSFGDEINKYYHTPADEAGDDFNFSYFLKFCKAYVHASRMIGNMSQTPFWKPGDSYEQAGRNLYQK